MCVYVGRYVGMCVIGGGEGGDGEVEIEVWEELIEVVAVSLSIDRGRRNSQDATPVIEGFHTRYVCKVGVLLKGHIHHDVLTFIKRLAWAFHDICRLT